MIEFWRTVQRRGDVEYELEIAWDPDAFEGNTPTIAVTARTREADSPEPRSELRAEVSLLNRDEGSPELSVYIGRQEIVGAPLADLLDESQIIDRIPGPLYGAGDPITGCLLRAGLSSVVRQIIRCRNETQDHPWYRPRIREIGRCLRANLGRMGARTALKAGQCILQAGF